jgi:hypothetical protein
MLATVPFSTHRANELVAAGRLNGGSANQSNSLNPSRKAKHWCPCLLKPLFKQLVTSPLTFELIRVRLLLLGELAALQIQL